MSNLQPRELSELEQTLAVCERLLPAAEQSLHLECLKRIRQLLATLPIESHSEDDALKEWLSSAKEDERRLHMRACELEEEFFGDLTLKDYEQKLASFDVEMDGEWVSVTEDLLVPGSLDIGSWCFGVVPDLDAEGQCNSTLKCIEISERRNKDDVVLLHEMIHAYEYMLAENTEIHKQYLVIDLYEKIFDRIPRLKEIIMFDAHTIMAEKSGRVHGPLFLLKSLDLDLKLDKPLGSVYGYGRESRFKDLLADDKKEQGDDR